LRNRRLQGLKFRRQHSVGEFIVDFVCLEKKLVVEVDGGYHDYVPDKDIRRQRYLESQGYRVIRFWNEDVLEDVDAVVRAIAQAAGLPPHPSPLPQRVAGDVDGPLRA
jgi:adenine-specific DNA-methyltransferase